MFLEKLLYEVCLIRIKEQVGEKSSTVCTHRYADCLLKNTSIKHSKYVVNQKLEHVEDISFRELFGRIRVVFYKIRSVCFTLYEASVVLNLSYINVREYQRVIKIWQSRETGNIGYTRRRRTKQKHNTICVGHHHTQTLISIVQHYEG